MGPGSRLVTRLAVCLGLFASTTLAAQRSALPAVLQVPYLPQSELLCGGAAVAMVERWWGRRGVYGEEFKHLVQRTRGGILSTDLVAATVARGWRAEAVSGDASVVAAALKDSVPVIAMIEVGRDRFHYVVIVGWGEGRVVFHDPARAPFASLPIATFEARWSAADHWAMLVRPNAPAPSDSALSRADTTSPVSVPTPLRDQGWTFFQAGRYLEAAALASQHLQQMPDDSLGWRLLASSRYLAGDTEGALAAWNRSGRPTVDLVEVAGARRLFFGIYIQVLGIYSGQILTVEDFRLARRRLDDIPSLYLSNVGYTAVPGGMVELQAAVVERPLFDPPRALVVRAIAGVLRHDLMLSVYSPTGLGERIEAQHRWDEARPRNAIRVEMPSGLGTFVIEESSEQFRFGDSALVLPPEDRDVSSLGLDHWLHSNLELFGVLRLERWYPEHKYLGIALSGALHLASDRLLLLAHGERAVPLQDQESYSRGGLALQWRVPSENPALTWSGRLGIERSSSASPRALWPRAGGSFGNLIPLRAHRYVVEEALPAAQSSRSVAHGGVGVDRTLGVIGPMDIGVGAFVDGARMLKGDVGAPTARSYLDVGAGIRIGLPGAEAGAVRVDVARGLLADKRWAISVGLEPRWPLRLREMR